MLAVCPFFYFTFYFDLSRLSLSVSRCAVMYDQRKTTSSAAIKIYANNQKRQFRQNFTAYRCDVVVILWQITLFPFFTSNLMDQFNQRTVLYTTLVKIVHSQKKRKITSSIFANKRMKIIKIIQVRKEAAKKGFFAIYIYIFFSPKVNCTKRCETRKKERRKK